MKTGALILGILGGLWLMAYGLIGFALGGLASEGGAQSGAGLLLQFFSVAVPILSLVGAGLATTRPKVAGGLMGLSGLAVLVVFGFNVITFLPVLFVGVGALLAVLPAQADAGNAANIQQTIGS